MSARMTHAERAALISRFVLMALMLGIGIQRQAWAAYPGKELLTFIGNFIIAPLSLIALVLAGVFAMWRPDAAKGAAGAAIIGVFLIFVIRMGDQIIGAITAN